MYEIVAINDNSGLIVPIFMIQYDLIHFESAA